MRIISPNNVYKIDFDISDIFAARLKWLDKDKFTMNNPRTSNGFLYFWNCSGNYVMDDGTTMFAPKGSIVYIPSNSTYVTNFSITSDSQYHTAIVEFNMRDKDGFFSLSDKPFKIMNAFASENASLIIDSAIEYSKPSHSSLMLKSLIYKMIYNLSMMYNYKIPDKFKCIEKGILHLENNILSQIKIEDLAQMCHMSSASFRRLFKEYSGVSPIDYCIRLRMDQAKRLLNDSSLSIENISYLLGFSSSSYFCRLFKKRFNITPSDYRGNHITL